MVQKILQHFNKKTLELYAIYLPSTTIRTVAIRTAILTEPTGRWYRSCQACHAWCFLQGAKVYSAGNKLNKRLLEKLGVFSRQQTFWGIKEFPKVELCQWMEKWSKKTQLFKEVEVEQLKVSVGFSYDSPGFFTVESFVWWIPRPFVGGGFLQKFLLFQ